MVDCVASPLMVSIHFGSTASLKYPGRDSPTPDRQVQFGFVADLQCAENETRRGRSFGFAPAFPSAARSYQALTFYPALTYGVDGDRIDRANFRIIGVGDRGLSGIVYRIKVACVRSKQGRHNAWGARFGKIADAEFHARKIKRQPPTGNRRLKAQRRFHAPDKKEGPGECRGKGSAVWSRLAQAGVCPDAGRKIYSSPGRCPSWTVSIYMNASIAARCRFSLSLSAPTLVADDVRM